MTQKSLSILSDDNKLVAVIVEPRYRWLRHLLLMLLLVVSYNSMVVTYTGNLGRLGIKVVYLALVQFAIYAAMAYFNIYVLMPRLFMKSRYILYCFSLLGTLTIVFFCGYLGEFLISRAYSFEPGLLSYVNSRHNLTIDYLSDVSIMGICCAGTSLTMMLRNWLTDGKRRQQMESRQLRANIDRLKTSVNSRFLSQVLESAAAKATTDSGLSVDILSRLGRYLRYRLYDSGRRVVILNSEAAFLDNYLALMAAVRGNFSYRIAVDNGAAPKAVPSSVLVNITDRIVGNIPDDLPVHMDIQFSVDASSAASAMVTARCTAISWLADRLARELGAGPGSAAAGIWSVAAQEDTLTVNGRLDAGWE